MVRLQVGFFLQLTVQYDFSFSSDTPISQVMSKRLLAPCNPSKYDVLDSTRILVLEIRKLPWYADYHGLPVLTLRLCDGRVIKIDAESYIATFVPGGRVP